jgi:YVTN family beta-propeller protein
VAQNTPAGIQVTTNQQITPTAAPGSLYLPLPTNLRPDDNANAGNAVSTALSPDGKTLLILTSGYNTGFSKVTGKPIVYPVLDPITGRHTGKTTPNAEWVFVYDVSGPAPVQKQKLNIPVTYCGLVWDPNGSRFYVSGGVNDVVYVFKNSNGAFVGDFPWVVLHTPEQLANTPAGPVLDSFGFGSHPVVAGLAVNASGSKLYVANYENDSVSMVDTASRKVTSTVTFYKPGGKVATGEYPFWIAVAPGAAGNPDKVFVSSQRDAEIMVFDRPDRIRSIKVKAGPNEMILSKDSKYLFVANGDDDSVSVIDTASESVVSTISLLRPGYPYKGANPNSLSLSPDASKLYVTLGGENAIAVVDPKAGVVLGRIPTGWYPNSVSASADGAKLYVVNAKDMPGPSPANENPGFPNPTGLNQYIYALQKAHLSMIPAPSAAELAKLSQQVDSNNGFLTPHTSPLIEALRNKLQHVIYIVKENRTYDEILGDLPVGNGDPALALYPRPVTPNFHQLALDFVTLDNFYMTSEVSGDGWNWTTQARTNDYTAKSVPLDYGNGFGALDVFGTNRNIEISLPENATPANQFTTRITTLIDPTGKSGILPGPRDIAAAEGDSDAAPEALGGYLWDEAIRKGLSVRHYGYFTDENYYNPREGRFYIPIRRKPFPNHPQGPPLKRTLAKGVNDIYYRGFDLKVPDDYHYEEWLREFKQYVANNNLPALEILSLPLDHTGDFESNVGGLKTPTLQIADNDYALGRIVSAVTKSPYWKNTAIFVVEDDAQAGPDHVDAHRSPAFVISPYTKRSTVVHTFYTHLNVMRTIEDLLGLNHLAMFDANADPMPDVFTATPDLTPYQAILPGVLCKPPVVPGLVPECRDSSVARTEVVPQLHAGDWWAKHTRQFDFSDHDRIDSSAFNRVLWRGIKGDSVPYPSERNGKDLSTNRAELLNSVAAGSLH